MDKGIIWIKTHAQGLSNMSLHDLNQLNKKFASSTAHEVLAYVVKKFKGKITLASSLGLEDQVLTHMLTNEVSDVDVFILDTGRFHQETYDVIEKTMTQYAFNYRVIFPDLNAVESMVSAHGPNHFYQRVENRKECCRIRKVEPLIRALNGYTAWITGIRRAQSIDRSLTPYFEWDDTHDMLKVNPLIKWSKDDVWNYVKRHDIPYNALHDRGYPSIGCAPCTRAVEPGEDDRSGRWWWEEAIKKECGLHAHTEGGD